MSLSLIARIRGRAFQGQPVLGPHTSISPGGALEVLAGQAISIQHVASGGNPPGGTWSKSNEIGATFTLNSDTGEITHAGLAAGNYSYRITIDNGQGTFFADKAVEALSPASSLFLTPVEPTDYTLVELTRQGTYDAPYPLEVTSSTESGITVGTTYASWAAVAAAFSTRSNFRIRLLSGSSAYATYLGPVSDGPHWIIGPVTSKAFSEAGVSWTDTNFPDAGVQCLSNNRLTTNSGRWVMKNFLNGPTEAQLAIDPNFKQSNVPLFQNNRGGYVDYINVVARNTNDNGGTGYEVNGLLTQQTCRGRWFGCDIFKAASDSGEHNGYWHDRHTWLVGSISRDTTGGAHQWKCDQGAAILYKSALIKSSSKVPSSNQSAVWDVTYSTCSYAYEAIFQDLRTGAGGGGVVQYVARDTAWGGFSPYTPAIFLNDDNGAGYAGYEHARYPTYQSRCDEVDSGAYGSSRVINEAQTTAAHTNAVTLSVRDIGSFPQYQSSGTLTLSLVTLYSIRAKGVDGSVYEIPSVLPSTVNVGGTGRATFDVSGSYPGGVTIPAAGRIFIKLASKGWGDDWDNDINADPPFLNPRYYNKNYTINGEPAYFPDLLRTAGVIDLAKVQAKGDFHVQEDCLYIIHKPGGAGSLVNPLSMLPIMRMCKSFSSEPVHPPLNNTMGTHRIPFNSGGTYHTKRGDVITGETSNATMTILGARNATGAWTAGSAAGYFYGNAPTGTFESGETVKVGANLNVATLTDVVAHWWPNIATAGSWGSLNTNAQSIFGSNPTGFVSTNNPGPNCDAFWYHPIFSLGNSVWTSSGTPGPPLLVEGVPNTTNNIYNTPNTTDFRYALADGTLKKATTDSPSDAPELQCIRMTLNGQHASGATTLNLNFVVAGQTTANLSVGMNIKVVLWPLRRGYPFMLNTTIATIPSSSSVTINAAIPTLPGNLIADGSEVSARLAVIRPSEIVTVEQFATRSAAASGQ